MRPKPCTIASPLGSMITHTGRVVKLRFEDKGALAERNGGGAEGIRTPGLLIANEALSQLSYSPVPQGADNAQRPLAKSSDPVLTIAANSLSSEALCTQRPSFVQVADRIAHR